MNSYNGSRYDETVRRQLIPHTQQPVKCRPNQSMPWIWLVLMAILLAFGSICCQESENTGTTISDDPTASHNKVGVGEQNHEKAQWDDPTNLEESQSSTDENLTSASSVTTPQYENDCIDDVFCLNGGSCVYIAPNKAECICPEGFYGDRCQTRNICKTVVANGQTGDQICDRIGRDCVKNDKFFRCSCLEDEYFVFKLNLNIEADHLESTTATTHYDTEPTTIADSLTDDTSTILTTDELTTNAPEAYYAECRPIDKCLGMRCKQLSEVCHKGKCICNRHAGYMPTDTGLCKLYDPCHKESVCGDAKCIATYNHELFTCVCPLGYANVRQLGADKSTTRCLLFESSIICLVPLLNKCEHLCHIDTSNNSYYCACHPGYTLGTNIGVDDNKCYFNYTLIDDEMTVVDRDQLMEGANFGHALHTNGAQQANEPTRGMLNHTSNYDDGSNDGANSDSIDMTNGRTGAPMMGAHSTKEMCNLECDTNEICVLKHYKDTRVYECECDRQGYARVGDRCLNWCEAAKFSNSLKRLLTMICFSGICRVKPDSKDTVAHVNEATLHELQGRLVSSWRPTFECNCDNEPILVLEQETGLCKIDFEAIMAPCRPGNVGYIDCVEQKNAFCVVLHEPWQFRLARSGKRRQKAYTCVCSPEKRFLVDKPRDKVRCVNECDLLQSECQRFNRMCRSATMDPNYYGQTSLIKYDYDGIKINSRRSVCECLPGFTRVLHSTDDDVSHSHCSYDSSDDNATCGASSLVGLARPATSAQANSYARCYLDYDVVEFHATFKAPSELNPFWLEQSTRLQTSKPTNKQQPERPAKVGGRGNGGQKNNDNNNNNNNKNNNNNNEKQVPAVNEAPKSIPLEDLPANSILIAHCDPSLAELDLEAYKQCMAYRYPLVHRFRADYLDWREVMLSNLKSTFDLMEGNINVHVDKCDVQWKDTTISQTVNKLPSLQAINSLQMSLMNGSDLEVLDADITCKLTLHSIREQTRPHRVLLEKQLPKLIFPFRGHDSAYYLMAPNLLIKRDSFDQLADHRKLFNPCKSTFDYCDKQTKCEMVDTVNFTCTCQYGYTPIGNRDIYYGDYRKEVCEDIDECLFDACKELANVSTCVNEVGDYRCQCNRHYIGDNKRYCTHVCNTIPCKHGKCRLVDDHHAFCECDEGYKETDCSVEDPNVALRKANMIIVGSIFTSVFLLAVTIAFSLNSQLRKIKKKFKRLEAATEAARLYEMVGQSQQTFRPRTNKLGSALSTLPT